MEHDIHSTLNIAQQDLILAGHRVLDQRVFPAAAYLAAPIHESFLSDGRLDRTNRTAAARWFSVMRVWKVVVVTGSGRRHVLLHSTKMRLAMRRNLPKTKMPLSLWTRHRSSL